MPSTVLQLRSGTTAQHTSFTGAPNEVTVDTTKKTLVVHDGATAGGSPLATMASVTKTAVGLANVDNTSDANKPVSTAQAAADNLRVLKSGDTITGGLRVQGSVRADAGIIVTPGVIGIKQEAQVLEGSAYRMRVYDMQSALNAPAQLYGEHIPGVSLLVRTFINGTTFDMNSSGQGSSAGGWIATSDQRVKTDNQVIDNALDKVDQLTGYTYLRQDMKDLSGRAPRKAGLIAQDVLKVLPESLTVPADYDAAANTGGMLALDSYGVIGLLVNAIKELRAEVNALKAA